MIEDFVDTLKMCHPSENFYDYLIVRRYHEIDLTLFADIVFQFLEFEVPSRKEFIEDTRAYFTSFMNLFPKSLLEFREKLLQAYATKGDVKDEFLALLHTVPAAPFSPQ